MVVRVLGGVTMPILVRPRGDSVTLVHRRRAAVGAGDTMNSMSLKILGGMCRQGVWVEHMSIGDMVSSRGSAQWGETLRFTQSWCVKRGKELEKTQRALHGVSMGGGEWYGRRRGGGTILGGVIRCHVCVPTPSS